MTSNSEYQLSLMSKSLESIVQLMDDLNCSLSSINDSLDELNDTLDDFNDVLSNINDKD